MTAAALRPARDRLAAILPARATLQSMLVESLNNRRAGDLALRASVTDRRDAPAWIALGDVHVAPLLANGAIPVLTDARGQPDAAAAAIALAVVEPVVAAIELVIAHPLLPTAVIAAPGDAAIVILIEAHAGGRTVHRLLLAAPGDATIAPLDALPLDPANIVAIAPGWTARIAAPALRRARVDGIGAGDLLLLGTGRPLARFAPPSCGKMLGCRLDVQGGSMIVEQMLEDEDDVSPAAGEGSHLADASVPITVEFDGGGLTLERLAALGAGSVVTVAGAAGGTLPVRLRADGRVIADGELVAVGDGYGVLVTAVARPRPAEG